MTKTKMETYEYADKRICKYWLQIESCRKMSLRSIMCIRGKKEH